MSKNINPQEISWLVQEKYQGRETEETRKDIERLQKDEHIDYVIGFVDFIGCKIDLSKNPLIPRSETEYWVQKAIVELKKDSRKKISCLDLFSGSGCVGVAILKHIEAVSFNFAEKDRRLLSQIKTNIKVNGIDNSRCKIFESDVFDGVKSSYDYIFANPPYIGEKDKDNLQESVLREEPAQALFGGEDGMLHIIEFLRDAKKYLNPGGKIYMEFGSSQKGKIEKLCKDYGYSDWKFYKDQYGKWRYVVVEE